MKIKTAKFIVLLFIVSFPLSLAAQNDSKHQIDAALEKCLGEKRGTFPRAECYSAASKMWEKAIAADYRKLLGELSLDLQKVLIREQAAWEKYRSENQKFVVAEYGKRRGSGYISVRIMLLMKPDRDRAIELENRFVN